MSTVIIGTWMLPGARRKAGEQATRPDAAPPRPDLVATVAFTAAAAGGAFLGHRIASRSAPEQLRRGFASFVILVGCFIAARTLSAPL